MLGRWAHSWQPGVPPPSSGRLYLAFLAAIVCIALSLPASCLWVSDVWPVHGSHLGRFLVNNFQLEEGLNEVRLQVFSSRLGLALLSAPDFFWRIVVDAVGACTDFSTMLLHGHQQRGLTPSQSQNVFTRALWKALSALVSLIGLLLALCLPMLLNMWALLSWRSEELDQPLDAYLRSVASVIDPLDAHIYQPLISLVGAWVGGTEELLGEEADRSACVRMKRLLVGQLMIMILLSSLAVFMLAMCVYLGFQVVI